VRVGAILGIVGVAAHSLVDFGLHMMANAVVFMSLIMLATTTLDLCVTSASSAPRR
jgi:hypothetical protein